MSIQNEILRLQGDSADIAEAIAAKGVTVPAGSCFDDYAELIGQISGGGGGSVLVPTAGDYPVVENAVLGGGGNALTSTGVSITIPVSGTYRLKWNAVRRTNTSGYTWSSRLYRTRDNQTSAIGTEITTWTSTFLQNNSLDIACEAGDVITVYVAGRSNSYCWGGNLSACVSQKLWTN